MVLVFKSCFKFVCWRDLVGASGARRVRCEADAIDRYCNLGRLSLGCVACSLPSPSFSCLDLDSWELVRKHGHRFGIFVFSPPVRVGVVRFYVSCPRPSSSPSSFSFFSLSASYFSVPSSRPSSSPAVCCNVQIAVGSARWAAPDLNGELQIADLDREARERSGQRRASTSGEPASGVGSAGPQLPETNSENMSDKNVRMHVGRNVRKNVRRYVRQEDMSEEMTIDMSENMSEKDVR